MLKFKITFKRSSSSGSFTNKKNYVTYEREFNDEGHYDNYIAKMESSYGMKMVGSERIYGEDKLYTAKDLNAAFLAGKSNEFKTTQEWAKFYLNTQLQ